MVFVQGALAATMCASLPQSAAAAVAAGSPPPCHEEAAADTRGNANLCVAHCESKSQSLDKPSVAVHSLPATPVLRVSLASVANVSRPSLFEAVPSGTPPPLIRFGVLLQ